MTSQLKEFKPRDNLKKYIDAFWFFRNRTGKLINFPVVPDGCNDIIFYLNNSKKLGDIQTTFVAGIMEQAQLIQIPDGMEFFGVRFKPGILFYLLKTNINKLTNNMVELSQLNNYFFQKLKIDAFAKDKDIIVDIEPQLEAIFARHNLADTFLKVVEDLIVEPNNSIIDLSTKYDFSTKNLERIFCKKVGLTPKKFARIMRFQKAHKKISREGLGNLIIVALSAGYFDQAHFNREYKKLIGYNPSNETMSILYNQ